MLLLIRKLKHDYFMNGKARKYMLYAAGEIVLIIIGIMIALQIDNWNTERHELAALKSHLQGIATNIRSDLNQAEQLLEQRRITHEAVVRADTFLSGRPALSVADVFTAGFAIRRAEMQLRFDVATSNYESLKASGVLKLLQGRDIEPLLFEYYESAARIESMEREYREVLRTLSQQFSAQWPDAVDPFEFFDPSALWAERFEEFEPAFRSIIENQSTAAVYSEIENQALLMLDYTNLIERGKVLLELIENDTTEFDTRQAAFLDGLYDRQSPTGNPALIADGQVAWHSYWLGTADAFWYEDRTSRSFNSASLQTTADGIRIGYAGGAQWAALWFSPIGLTEGRISRDFSPFNRLRLELKGDRGDETIRVHLKDRDDPDDGSQTDIELRLTDQGKIYEIDLAAFEHANPGKLHVALGFLFGEEGQSFRSRNARVEDAG